MIRWEARDERHRRCRARLRVAWAVVLGMAVPCRAVPCRGGAGRVRDESVLPDDDDGDDREIPFDD